MESELYKVTKKDLPKLQALLNKCFASDPLYETLIPNEDIRKKLLPKLFACDMEEFYKNCDIFADSPDGKFSLRDLFDKAEKNGRLGFVVNEGILFHVGVPEAVRETEKKLLAIAC